MSYYLYILDAEVLALVEEGYDLPDIDQPELDPEDRATLEEHIPDLGYELETDDDDSQSYVKDVDGCPIRLDLFATEITLTVPDWEGSDDAIDEAIQDAAELSDLDSLVCYDPQTDEWIE